MGLADKSATGVMWSYQFSLILIPSLVAANTHHLQCPLHRLYHHNEKILLRLGPDILWIHGVMTLAPHFSP